MQTIGTSDPVLKHILAPRLAINGAQAIARNITPCGDHPAHRVDSEHRSWQKALCGKDICLYDPGEPLRIPEDFSLTETEATCPICKRLVSTIKAWVAGWCPEIKELEPYASVERGCQLELDRLKFSSEFNELNKKWPNLFGYLKA